MIKVIDLFAGPGGLGEGFASFQTASGRRRFELAVSIEKDAMAHRTLRLRAFARQYDGCPPTAYYQHLRGQVTWEQLAQQHRKAAAVASREALQIELCQETVPEVHERITDALNGTDNWVLIGGPPCQAYSLVGRARNKGKKGYVPEEDRRQTLYVEYLQIVADHAPPVFVMENVKGLLSAQLDSRGMFERILSDLRDPAAALRREGRPGGDRSPKYEIRALAANDFIADDDPRRFVVCAEKYGVPQRRHRVILVGIRSDCTGSTLPTLTESEGEMSVSTALLGLPRVRSGLSKGPDSDEEWLRVTRDALRRGWLSQVKDEGVRLEIRRVVEAMTAPRASRGGEVLGDEEYDLVLNHSTRGHIVGDLDRYLFASCFAKVKGQSPVIGEFPEGLLPSHENLSRGAKDAAFADRFRAQVGKHPSTTVTSHISKDGHYYIHPDPSQCRSLTVREAARLQSFPNDYFFCGPRTAQYQQVGNAVPPRLASRIAKSVAAIF